MRFSRRALLLVAACGALLFAPEGAATALALQGRTSATAPSTAETSFALSLLRELGSRGNLVFSPYSVDLALTMADAGAHGRTAAQIAHVLGASSPQRAVADATALRSALGHAVGSGSAAPTLDIANALWTQTGLPLGAPFVSTLTDDFGAPPQSTDFASAPDAALRAINGWVSEHTDAVIPTLLGPGTITPQTAFVLANAIFLKAAWQDPFSKTLTQQDRFTTSGGAVVTVPFMHEQTDTYPYAAAAGYQAVDLPYASSSLSLLAILPKRAALLRFEHGLSTRSLAAIVGRLSPARVDLAMPKLNLSSQESLNATLQKLGMTDAFGPAADFSGVTTQRSLDISLVEHAAVLKVDEQGTVAAGATAVVSPTLAVPVTRRPVSLVLNRPFLLLLRDDSSGAVLFVANVENPSQG